MSFRVSEEQRALADGVRRFCAGRFELARLRALEEAPLDRGLWRELAELGAFALRLPEARGGLGLGAPEAALVFEELGRALVPGPLSWTHLAAEHVPGAAEGQLVVGGLDLACASSQPLLVEHAAALDALVVLREGGVERVDPRALEARPVAPPLDPLTPVAHVAQLPPGEPLGGAELAARWRAVGAVLAAAQLLGIAESALELAVAHASKRHQFGRPIGSFQALKHMMADMFARQELARAAVYAAAAGLAAPEAPGAARAVSSAKLVAGEAAEANARAAIQIHGGMGYTWEVPLHYLLKRAWLLDTVFGTRAEHAERIARSVGEGAAA